MKIDKKSLYISACGMFVVALIASLGPNTTPLAAEYSMFLLKSSVIFFVIANCLKDD